MYVEAPVMWAYYDVGIGKLVSILILVICLSCGWASLGEFTVWHNILMEDSFDSCK